MRYNPFNPQLPARPDFFVGRKSEVKEFEKFMTQTSHNYPMNMSITGNRGVGKTSILMKFEQISKDNKCLVVRLSNYEGNINNIIELSDYIISNIKTEILSKKPIGENFDKFKNWISTLKPSIGWNDINLSLEKKQIVQEILRQKLNKLWNEIKKDYKACIILFDEAESLEKTEGALTFLREVFQRIEDKCNYMIVLAGNLNFPEKMSESFSPLNRFFPSSRLMPLKENDIRDYIYKKFGSEDVYLDEYPIQFIIENSEGHPYILVAMCYLIFDSLRDEEKRITIDIIKRSEEKIYAKLSQNFFSPMFCPLTPKAKKILKIICSNVQNLQFDFSDVVKWTKIERNYVSPYIQELFKKGIINKLERGTYILFHKLFINYVNSLERDVK
ncbi:MAG: ATP-binding protein [Nanoarchaeota archaeon]|nr:ATP-binding protein [Nanoarchaeota archaeon]